MYIIYSKCRFAFYESQLCCLWSVDHRDNLFLFPAFQLSSLLGKSQESITRNDRVSSSAVQLSFISITPLGLIHFIVYYLLKSIKYHYTIQATILRLWAAEDWTTLFWYGAKMLINPFMPNVSKIGALRLKDDKKSEWKKVERGEKWKMVNECVWKRVEKGDRKRVKECELEKVNGEWKRVKDIDGRGGKVIERVSGRGWKKTSERRGWKRIKDDKIG